jgi:hypothetical protein
MAALPALALSALSGSDQGNQLIFKDNDLKNRPFQSLKHHFHAPKCPYKAKMAPSRVDVIFLKGPFVR